MAAMTNRRDVFKTLAAAGAAATFGGVEPVMAAKPGKYEVPGKLKYFFCSKADGFCSFQVLDVKIPVSAE